MRYTVDSSGLADYPTINKALAAARHACDDAAVLEIAAGTYREKLTVDLPGATLIGAGTAKTRIVWQDSAHLTHADGMKLGTFRTPTLCLSEDTITLRNLTVENDAGPGEQVEQAVALHIAGDRCAVWDCALIAHQDTLLIGPEKGNIAEPPLSGKRAWLSRCLIRGNVDFIFGSYAAWFERCTLWCVSRGEAVNAMISAPNTPEGQPFGFVFHRCAVNSNCEPGTVWLGRPWRPFGRSAFLHCSFPASVASAGWLDWASPFRSVWPGLCETADTYTSARHSKAGCLTPVQEAAYTPSAVLSGPDGWAPWRSDSRAAENTASQAGSGGDFRMQTRQYLEDYFRDYLTRYQPYKTYWNYEDGCVLVGCIELWHATGDLLYRSFVLDYLARFVMPDGSIPNYETEQYNIDSINTGKALFFALDETGDERYRKAIEFHMQRLREHPRCLCGNFWHKSIYPNQIWLDGLYMAQPFYMAYEMRFGGMVNVGDIVAQFQNVRKYLFSDETRLYYHAFDEARVQPWADAVTGCSKNHWLRSMGWYLMALVDCLALLDEQLFEHVQALKALFQEAIRGILPYRDEKSGLFLQVIDHPEAEGNYAETSGSAMVAYALLKGAAIGMLIEEKMLPIGCDVFVQLAAQKLVTGAGGKPELTGICKVAGLGPGEKRDGSVAYYLSEPVVADDSKGVGPFMMACARWIAAARKE